MSKINKCIDLSTLPRFSNSDRVSWKDSVGYKINFIYDDVEGFIEITKFSVDEKHNSMLNIRYLNKDFIISARSVANCNFGEILNKLTNKFKIEIGKNFHDDKRNLIILNKEYRDNRRGNHIKYYQYKCLNCNYVGWTTEYQLLNQCQGCPVCCYSPSKVAEGINDIPTTAPWMVKYFQGGYDEAKLYSYGSHTKIYPICPDCGKIRTKPITICHLYTMHGIACSCGGGVLYPEKFFISLLNQLNINYIFQATKNNLNWCQNFRYDFIILDKSCIIEVNGEQHYNNKIHFHYSNKDITDIHKKDILKEQLAKDNGIKNYIIIDARKSELEFIKKSIMESNLSKLFDLSNINWNECQEYALSNIIKEICTYRKEHPTMTTGEIGKVYKLNCNTIASYLRKGNEIGWCVYNPKDELRRILDTYRPREYKHIKCINTGEEFKSISHCANQSMEKFGVKLSRSCISVVCRGKRKATHGLSFEFVDNY